MAKATINGSKASSPKGSHQFPLLQNHLILNRYFCQLFGYQDFRGLREALREQKEGWAEDGHSSFFRVLEGREGLKIPPDQLATYDLRIKGYVEQLNRFRTPPIQLKYFQYLAVLFTEVYLRCLFAKSDCSFTHSASLLEELNRFVEQEKEGNPSAASFYQPFTEDDLRKLAFWMATGSGKTLILHINLWQYLHYSQGKERPNNILLITPNEGLSRQHLEELRKSGIPAGRHGEAEGRGLYFGSEEPLVTVIEITKLVENKRGGGERVEVGAFGDNNLLFVDEGHRGASGEVWRNLRQRLAERGFTFEYSATFGQMVNGASKDKRPALLEEYSKAILFDYSYRHFYEDGYGKDYWILNLKDSPKADNNAEEGKNTYTQWMLLGNLLSFYQQLSVYQEHRETLRPYNLEKPLWVFVGHTVTGGKSQDDEKALSDVEEIVLFFKDFLDDPEQWTDRISDLLLGKTGLKDPNDEDIFKNLFPYLWNTYLQGKDPNAKEIYRKIYEDIVRRVFAAKPGDSLRVVELKGAAGEIGLKAGSGNPCFGVINIGDVAGLMQRLEAKHLKREEENFYGSLFTRINEPDSPVNVLIGSRKFMEGWDSFRVSSMGLMNIGRGEGPQIIQLFGRGVRLRGKGFSLKRSGKKAEPCLPLLGEGGARTVAEGDGGKEAEPCLPLLETLYVFGVRANYMAQFRDYLEQEGIQANFEELRLPIDLKHDFLKYRLQVLRLPDGERFEKERGIVLKVEPKLKVTLDLRPRVELARSGENQAGYEEKPAGEDKAALLRQWAPLLDWRRIYFDLLAFKRLKGFHNLVFSEATLREIVEGGRYTILCTDNQLKPLDGAVAPEDSRRTEVLEDFRRAEDIAIALLRKYVAAFYGRERRKWEGQKVILEDLKDSDPNLAFKSYTLRVERSDQKFLKHVHKLIQCTEIYSKDVDRNKFPNIHNIHFDRHLYLPLLKSDGRLKSTPPALNQGEAEFVEKLRSFLQTHGSQFEDKQVFLLRNLTRGKGLGFFDPGEGEAFYPDFILWVLQDRRQWIAFIDPHGLRMARGGFNDPKVKLREYLKALEPRLQQELKERQRDGTGPREVHLTSFILSTSRFEEIRKTFGTGQHSKEEFEAHNILFMEDPEYISKLFQNLLDEKPATGQDQGYVP